MQSTRVRSLEATEAKGSFHIKRGWFKGNPVQKNAWRREKTHNFLLSYIIYRQENLNQWNLASYLHFLNSFLGLWLNQKPKTQFRVAKLSASVLQGCICCTSGFTCFQPETTQILPALLFPVSLNPHLWFASSWQLYWHISSFLIHLLPYLLSLFLTSCGPHSSIPQPGLLPWKCLSFSKLNCCIFLCVALPECTGFSPLQLSGINVHIILRQPPWFPIQLKFVPVVFKACLRHASGSLIQLVSLRSSSCSSWLSSTWFPVFLQELCVFLEIFTRTIPLNKKWFCFMLHSHPFGSSIEGEFASRNICRHSKSEEYRSEYFWNMNTSICKESQL